MSKALAGKGAIWTKCSDCGKVHVWSKNLMNKEHPDFICRGCGITVTVEGLK